MIKRVEEFGADPLRIAGKLKELMKPKLKSGVFVTVTPTTVDPVVTFALELSRPDFDDFSMMRTTWERLLAPNTSDKASFMLGQEPYQSALAITQHSLQELEKKLDIALAQQREP